MAESRYDLNQQSSRVLSRTIIMVNRFPEAPTIRRIGFP